MTARRVSHRRIRWARLAAWIGGALVGTFVLFCLAVNAMLAFGGVEAIVTRETEYTRVELQHGRAWMLWPMRVHVRDATILIDSYSYEFQAEVREAVVDIRLVSLFSRRFRAESIAATGVRAIYREKVDAADADSPRLAAFAPVEGTPPEIQPSEPKPRPDRDDAWGIDLDEVDAEIESLWVDEFNTTPCGHIAGGLHWTDGHEFEVTTTTVDLEAAALWIGDREAMRAIHAHGSVELAEFVTAETEGKDLPGYLSFDVELQAQVREPAALEVYLPKQQAGRIHAGTGSITAALTVDAGVFQSGSAVHYQTDHIEFHERQAQVTSGADLMLEVTSAGHPRASVEVTDAKLVTAEGVAARAPMARASVTADRASMMEHWSMIAAHLVAPDVVVDDLRGISELHPKEYFRFTDGSGRGAIAAELDEDGAVASTVTTSVRDAAMQMTDVRLKTSATSRARVRFAKGGAITIDRVRARFDDIDLTTPKGKSKNTWARIDDATVRIRGRDTTIDVRGEVEDARPAIIHLTRLDPLVRAIPDLERGPEPIASAVHMRFRPRAVDIEIERAEQLGLRMRGLWRLRGKDWRGAFLFSGTAAIGFALEAGGLIHLVPAGKEWLETRTAWVKSLGAGHRDARAPVRARARN